MRATRYRELEKVVEAVMELDLNETRGGLIDAVTKLKRKAQRAFNFKEAPRNENMEFARAKAREASARKLKEFRDSVRPWIRKAEKDGATTRQAIADWLNKNEVTAPRGGAWSAASVDRLLRDYSNRP